MIAHTSPWWLPFGGRRSSWRALNARPLFVLFLGGGYKQPSKSPARHGLGVTRGLDSTERNLADHKDLRHPPAELTPTKLDRGGAVT